MKALIVGLVLFVAVALFADAMVKNVAEDRAAEYVRDTMGLDVDPQVSFSGFPFVIHAVKGSFEEVRISVNGARVSKIDLDSIEVTLDDVRVGLADILRGDSQAVRTAGGSGEISISEEAFLDAIGDDPDIETVRFTADGSVIVEDARLPQPVRGRLSLRRNSVVISAGQGVGYSFDLPILAGGMTYRDLSVGDGVVVLAIDLPSGRLRSAF